MFALNSQGLGTTMKHEITTDLPPIRQPVCRMPFALRDEVDNMVQEMLIQDVIQPPQKLWASSIVLMKKKDGGIQFCVDYILSVELGHQV